MISFDQLRSSPVGLEWHEAVALTAALAGTLVESAATRCPHPVAVFLLPTGEVRVSGDAEMSGDAAAGLAAVLAVLLEHTPCPAELRQLADLTPHAAEDPLGTIVRFSSELMFFERPDRTAVLSALFSRAEVALERAARTAALQALTERTRHAAGAPGLPAPAPIEPPAPVVPLPVPVPPVPAPARHATDAVVSVPAEPAEGDGETKTPRAREWWGQAAIAVAVFLVTAFAASYVIRPEATAPAGAPMPLEEDLPIDAGPRPPRPGGDDRATASRPRSGDTAPTGASAKRGAADGGSRDAASAGTSPPATPPRPPEVDVVVAEGAGRVLPSGPVGARAPSGTAGPIYDASDPTVTPAVLLHPAMPARPPADVPEEQLGTLVFVIDEAGAVERVHLLSPANRYQERMLVAAAKNWRFRPAMRDGRAVRYQTRIRLRL